MLLGGEGFNHSSVVTGGGIGVDTVVMDTSPMIARASFVAWYMRSNSSRLSASSADSSIRLFYSRVGYTALWDTWNGEMYTQWYCGIHAVALWDTCGGMFEGTQWNDGAYTYRGMMGYVVGLTSADDVFQ